MDYNLKPIVNLDTYIDILRVKDDIIYGLIYNQIYQLYPEFKLIYRNQYKIYGFDIDGDDLYIHYRCNNRDVLDLVGVGKYVDVDSEGCIVEDSIGTVMIDKGKIYWCLSNEEDYDTKDISSSLDYKHGKIWLVGKYKLDNMIAYGIKGIGGMTIYDDNLYIAHNGQNWNSIYMIDDRKYVGWRYYDGPIVTIKPIESKWLVMYNQNKYNRIKPVIYHPKHNINNMQVSSKLCGISRNKYIDYNFLADMNGSIYEHEDIRFTAIDNDYISIANQDDECMIYKLDNQISETYRFVEELVGRKYNDNLNMGHHHKHHHHKHHHHHKRNKEDKEIEDLKRIMRNRTNTSAQQGKVKEIKRKHHHNHI